MSSKHFINDPSRLVATSLQSLPLLNPSVVLDAEQKVVYLRESHVALHKQVTLVSGGGSGHEPAFGSYVGAGLLSASIAGTIFASPSSKQILAGLDYVNSPMGTLVIIMGYTGDVLNFGVAVEKAKARNPERRIEMIVVGDDVGVPRSRSCRVGRRGIAGTVLVHKIGGALAAHGLKLDEIVRTAKLACDNLVSLGASLERVHVPGRKTGSDSTLGISPDEVELGMGIHNEPGCGRRRGSAAELPALVREMLSQLLDPADPERGYLRETSGQFVLLVNNLGGLSELELGAVVTQVVKELDHSYGIQPVRMFAGVYMTSLDGRGFSISLLRCVDTGLGLNFVQLLDEKAETLGWKSSQSVFTRGDNIERNFNDTWQSPSAKPLLPELSSGKEASDLRNILLQTSCALEAVTQAEPEITRFDTFVGDGDCGITLKRGAEALNSSLLEDPPESLTALLQRASLIVEDTMDGTSGALYSIYVNALLQYFAIHTEECSRAEDRDPIAWCTALQFAMQSLNKYTPARPGDRTVVDALSAFVTTLATTQSVRRAVEMSAEAADKTKYMRPALGRSVYVGNEEQWLGQIPDPGAWGLSKFLGGLVHGCSK